MADLLFLAHRIPFPPNKGDKIRSFHLLRHLSRRHRIFLGAFVDDPQDWVHLESLRPWCQEIHCLPLDPRRAKLRSLTGLLRGQALTLPYYHDQAMAAWVTDCLDRQDIRQVVVYSSAMAQYVLGPRHRALQRVVDFVDVDSDKWRQYARSRRWPLSWVYRREGETLLAFDRQVARESVAAVFVSPAEAELFRQLAPESAQRVVAVGNGVDTDYFNPARDYPCPYRPDEQVLVFTGAMDYWANVDAVNWFAREVFPMVRQRLAQARFYIVGSRPAATVERLQELPGVVVTGAVADVRPYLAHARLAVAPLRIARGIQNKVLEALAMDRPLVASRAAVDGLLTCADLERSVADGPRAMADLTIARLQDCERNGPLWGRRWVQDHYSWQRNLTVFDDLLDEGPARERQPPVEARA